MAKGVFRLPVTNTKSDPTTISRPAADLAHISRWCFDVYRPMGARRKSNQKTDFNRVTLRDRSVDFNSTTMNRESVVPWQADVARTWRRRPNVSAREWAANNAECRPKTTVRWIIRKSRRKTKIGRWKNTRTTNEKLNTKKKKHETIIYTESTTTTTTTTTKVRAHAHKPRYGERLCAPAYRDGVWRDTHGKRRSRHDLAFSPLSPTPPRSTVVPAPSRSSTVVPLPPSLPHHHILTPPPPPHHQDVPLARQSCAQN